jgi:hypothetical protein
MTYPRLDEIRTRLEQAIADDRSTHFELLVDCAAEIDRLREQCDEYKVLAAVGTWHADCRPNRQKAAQELLKSQAVIDKLADRISELELLITMQGSLPPRPSVGEAAALDASPLQIAAQDVVQAVRCSADHTTWFESLGHLMRVIEAGSVPPAASLHPNEVLRDGSDTPASDGVATAPTDTKGSHTDE